MISSLYVCGSVHICCQKQCRDAQGSCAVPALDSRLALYFKTMRKVRELVFESELEDLSNLARDGKTSIGNGCVSITAVVSTNGATKSSRMNFSGYVGHVTAFS